MMTEQGSHPHDPLQAGVPRTAGETKVYENDEIRVLWNASRCIHVATCLNALPEVFDVHSRPWIDVGGAGAEQIAEAVRLCPTGALRYEGKGALPEEQPDEPTTVQLRPNGPLYMRGQVRIVDPAGRVIAEESRVALCRCGRSQNKPFCDNSHRLPRPDAEF